MAAFNTAVETVRGFGNEVVTASAPFDTPPFGDVRAIEADRETVADRAFRDFDVLLLPTTADDGPQRQGRWHKPAGPLGGKHLLRQLFRIAGRQRALRF
jgi:hypothetical protein